MSYHFFRNQTKYERKLYIDLLDLTGSLSNMYSNSKTPFLYYRAMENIFCKAFKANDLSRNDISADASKNKTGIGLKTFLHNNGKTLQKVAEFNKESYLFKELELMDLVIKVSEMRNERIKSTMRMAKLNDMIYHMVTRSKNYMALYEENMDLIDTGRVRIINQQPTTIHFTDGQNEYSFSRSKNTLFKRFITHKDKYIYGFNIKILEDPFDFLLKSKIDRQLMVADDVVYSKEDNKIKDSIILPLYSTRSGKVPNKSGLNNWNAAGRKRHEDEVYIPVPSWIHKVKKGFFNYNTADNRTDPFDVKLPNGERLSMRVTQAGGKGLQSNPNSALGNWILRDVLQIMPKVLVTSEMLDTIGIDSVQLSKMENNKYSLDFLKTGSYDEYKQEYM